MIESLRRRIAALSYILVVNQNIYSVFDYDENNYFNFSSNRNGTDISIYDYSASSFFSGYIPNIYDYEDNAFISVNVTGNSLSIYSYKYNGYFSVTVNGNNVSVFDYKHSEYHNYVVN